jgi:hypothetical protein
MMFRGIIAAVIGCFSLCAIARAQEVVASTSAVADSEGMSRGLDFSEVVVPIASVKLRPSVKMGLTGNLSPSLHVGAGFGSGFCLDAECRFIATNYHVAMLAEARKIKGEKVVHRYLGTGPKDNGATPNFLPGYGVLPYAVDRDLAILEVERPLRRHHGAAYSLDELEAGQEVDIYGYPNVSINPKRKLTKIPATFRAPTTSGLLAFAYETTAGRPLNIHGASGGIVVDRKSGRVVGVLSGTSDGMALAVPVQNLVDFVSKAQPFLAQRLFPLTATTVVSPVPGDLYAKFVPPRASVLARRPEEPQEVVLLRQKAEALADGMRNFIAVQSFAWGSGNQDPRAEAEYEVQVIDGSQRFREYPDGKKELEQPPYPHLSGWVLPSDQWSTLPKMVGTEYRLKIRQAADAVVRNKRFKVFQYYASAEDNLCPFAPVEDFGFFSVTKTVAVACYGEVWTDEGTNIVRISENLDLSEKRKDYRGWESYQVVLTYGWVQRTKENSWLVPLTIFTEAREKKHVYWCRGHFTGYQMFDARARLLSN